MDWNWKSSQVEWPNLIGTSANSTIDRRIWGYSGAFDKWSGFTFRNVPGETVYHFICSRSQQAEAATYLYVCVSCECPIRGWACHLSSSDVCRPRLQIDYFKLYFWLRCLNLVNAKSPLLVFITRLPGLFRHLRTRIKQVWLPPIGVNRTTPKEGRSHLIIYTPA